eukprot:scpid65922/ scgid21919/ Palmitoyltransferase ZDHHC9; Zinc finger DHHC domain-containing protein 9
MHAFGLRRITYMSKYTCHPHHYHHLCCICFLDCVCASTLVIVIIAFFAMWSVIGMCGYHTMLVGNAKTTNEEIKVTYGSNARQSTKNPYHQGSAWENLKYTLCAPLPRSLLDRRGQLTDDEYYAIRDETINSASSAARNLMGTTLPSSSSPSSSLSVTRVANTAPLRQTDPAEGDRLMTAE